MSRKTIYRHLEPVPTPGEDDDRGRAELRPVPARIRKPGEPTSPEDRELRDRIVQQKARMQLSRCPNW